MKLLIFYLVHGPFDFLTFLTSFPQNPAHNTTTPSTSTQFSVQEILQKAKVHGVSKGRDGKTGFPLRST